MVAVMHERCGGCLRLMVFRGDLRTSPSRTMSACCSNISAGQRRRSRILSLHVHKSTIVYYSLLIQLFYICKAAYIVMIYIRYVYTSTYKSTA